MRKSLIFGSCLLLVLWMQLAAAWAQQKDHPYAPFEKEGVVRLFGDQVNVREGAGTTYIVRGTLPAGTQLQILEQSFDWFMPVDYEEPWYRVRTRTPDGNTIVGYVWGGLIADQSFETDLDGDGELELLMIKNRTWNKCKMWDQEVWKSGLEFRVMKDGMFWASGDYATDYASNLEVEPFVIPFENGSLWSLKLSYDWEYCESGKRNALFLLRLGKFEHQFDWFEQMQGKELSCADRPVFPGDPMGKNGQVIIYRTCEHKDGSQSFDTQVYHWNGTAFRQKQ